MNGVQIQIVTVPLGTWESWPTDRSLRALAQDAVACERRIAKRVNVSKERLRYTLLCSQIESLAVRLLSEGVVAHSWTLATDTAGTEWGWAYLRFMEFLQSLDPSEVSAATTNALAHQSRGFWAWLWAFLRWLFGPGTTAEGDSEDQRAIRAQPIGKSFYPPGFAVREQRRLFEGLTSETIRGVLRECPEEHLGLFASLAKEKAAFYRKAERNRAAVVEVVCMAEMSPPRAAPIV